VLLVTAALRTMGGAESERFPLCFVPHHIVLCSHSCRVKRDSHVCAIHGKTGGEGRHLCMDNYLPRLSRPSHTHHTQTPLNICIVLTPVLV
jgi:hypothetical protein